MLRKGHKYSLDQIYLFISHVPSKRTEQSENRFSLEIAGIRDKIGERGMIYSFICMLDLVMFKFDIIPCVVGNS